MVATNEGQFKLDKPIIECPEVQPLAQRVPKPTKNPPKTIKINPFNVNISLNENISDGISPSKFLMPTVNKSALVASAICIGLGLANNVLARKAPITIPTTKNKFQLSFFQLYLKKGILAGTQAAQIWRNDEDIPNGLLPKRSNIGTVRPIKTPAIDQCQGFLIISINIFSNFM